MRELRDERTGVVLRVQDSPRRRCDETWAWRIDPIDEEGWQTVAPIAASDDERLDTDVVRHAATFVGRSLTDEAMVLTANLFRTFICNVT